MLHLAGGGWYVWDSCLYACLYVYARLCFVWVLPQPIWRLVGDCLLLVVSTVLMSTYGSTWYELNVGVANIWMDACARELDRVEYGIVHGLLRLGPYKVPLCTCGVFRALWLMCQMGPNGMLPAHSEKYITCSCLYI